MVKMRLYDEQDICYSADLLVKMQEVYDTNMKRLFMSNVLKDQFASAVSAMSYYNAAEYPMWGRETEKREQAKISLQNLYKQMVETFGEKETNDYLETLPRLLGSGDLCNE
jgi:hypothetical protein